MKLSQIKENPDNPRTISKQKFELLKKSIKDFPAMMALRPIVIDENGNSLGGNMRKRALAALGYKDIPDEWVKRASELTEEQKREFIIKDNATAFGEWDWSELANAWSDLPLSDWGVDIPEDWAPAETVKEDESAVGEMIDKAAELQKKWKVKRGQIWEIGRHRLMCGDSLSADDVSRLMAGQTAQMVFADPPYGIEIVSTEGTLRSNTAQPFGGKKKGSVGGAKPFGPKTAVEAHALTVGLFPKAAHIWWGANHYGNALPASPCWIVWDKENTGNFADAELAWTNQPTAVRIFKHMWNGLMKESEKGQKRVHPTQKPVALGAWCFEKYGKEGDIILDPFGGSAMAMKAAHETNRSCYAMEMAKDYCAVHLETMSALGLTPKLTK
jgi:hypothetical protein